MCYNYNNFGIVSIVVGCFDKVSCFEGEVLLESIIEIDRIENIAELFGSFDGNMRIIENEYAVSVVERGSELKISGDIESVDKAKKVIENLIVLWYVLVEL